MKPEHILRAMNDVDYELIAEAETERKAKGRIPLRWLAAACLVMIFTAGALILAQQRGAVTMIDGIERRYKNTAFTVTEIMMEWPWEYLTPMEQYTQMTFGGRKYRTRAQEIRGDLLGDLLGTCQAEGYDMYKETVYSREFEVRAVKGADSGIITAVNMDGTYVVFFCDDNPYPETMGAFLASFSLSETMPLSCFSIQDGHKEQGYYTLNDDGFIWQTLEECGDAPLVPDDAWNRADRNYVSFTAVSEALGVYKKVIYVSEDGFFRTNMMDYAGLYEIGEEAAGKIIVYAKEHGEEAAFEPYHKSIAGTVAAIEEGYVLIDDTLLCRDPDDGMMFRVPTDDLRISRCLYSPYSSISVGDAVRVEYTGTVDTADGNTVNGAFSMMKGRISDGQMEVPE